MALRNDATCQKQTFPLATLSKHFVRVPQHDVYGWNHQNCQQCRRGKTEQQRYHLAASKKELSFAALADGIQISQSALSQHLMKLRKGGLIGAQRAGHNSFYRLSDPRAAQLAIGLQKILKYARGGGVQWRGGE